MSINKENVKFEKILGQMIRNRRKECDLTSQDLAGLTGCSSAAIRYFEAGDHAIRLVNALRIAKVLCIDFRDIVELLED
jgi:DNA-binding XRE family transcriptional regulator